MDLTKFCKIYHKDAAKCDSCVELAQQCVKQDKSGASKFKLKGPDNKTFTASSLRGCLRQSMQIPKIYGPLPKTTTPDPKDNSKKKKAYGECNNLAKPGETTNSACRGYIDICFATPKGPYALPVGKGKATAKDRNECIERAQSLSSRGYSPPKPKRKTARNKSARPAKSKSKDVATDSNEPQESLYRYRKSFADINLRLRVTGDKYTKDRRTLLFEGGKGITIVMKYSVKRDENSSYRIDYTIFKSGKKLGDEQSLTFKVDDGKINLAFELELKRANDFGDVESIRIVDLSS